MNAGTNGAGKVAGPSCGICFSSPQCFLQSGVDPISISPHGVFRPESPPVAIGQA